MSRIDEWLYELLRKRCCSDISWVDEEKSQFKIAWTHGSSRMSRGNAGFLKANSIFLAWQTYRGRGNRPCDPKRLKQNLRCALNGCRRHLRHRPELSRTRRHCGNGGGGAATAYRVYEFLPAGGSGCCSEMESGGGAFWTPPPTATEDGAAASDGGDLFAELSDWSMTPSPLTSDGESRRVSLADLDLREWSPPPHSIEVTISIYGSEHDEGGAVSPLSLSGANPLLSDSRGAGAALDDLLLLDGLV